jgi:predicted lipoprotein with Yx(FWY)xxD motif
VSRSRPNLFVAAAAVVTLAALIVAGCGSGGSASSVPPKTSNGSQATVGVGSSGLGAILVNSQGRTLYLFQKDSGTMSACTDSCAGFWPPLQASGKPTVGSGANSSLLATAMQSDGRSQVIYNGHPLYLYSGDKKPGDANGQGLTAFGGGWFALSAAGTQVSGQGSNPGGYGY